MTDNKNRIIIFDTTLRDGEQALQQSLSVKQKLQIALALEQLGVDVIEAGFPVSSPGDFESVQKIAQTLKKTICCGLARAVDKDIDACYEALKEAESYRIHTFIATSDVHVQSKLHRSFDDVVEMAQRAVKRARHYTDDVEFSCEDAGRTPIDNLCRMVETVIRAGATTVNIPDTVGYTLPYEFGGIIRALYQRVPNIDKAVISVHCHNDLGMATANSLTAVMEGARQIECTMNGLGERAGNTALEEVAMAIKLRTDYMNNVYTNIEHSHIARTAQIVSGITNEPIASHKAIIGSNAFAHSSGIHQDGVLKNKNTYEILTPQSIGFKNNNLHMTARSGRHMIQAALTEMGYTTDMYDLDDIYQRFLKLADKKGQVFDYDLEALLFLSHEHEIENHFELMRLNVISGDHQMIPTASVQLKIKDKICTDSSTGNGPVDAVFQCILRLTGMPLTLSQFVISAKGSGMDAQGQVDVDVLYNNRCYHGKGLSTDVIEASALALLAACNSIYNTKLIEQEKQGGYHGN